MDWRGDAQDWGLSHNCYNIMEPMSEYIAFLTFTIAYGIMIAVPSIW